MSKYAISEFVQQTAQRDRGEGKFEMENDRVLEVNLNGRVWTKTGSMIAYTGPIRFTREGVMEHGLGRMLKKALTGEGTALTKAEGNGKLYLADEGKKIVILDLQGESLFVNGNDLLAFEESIDWDIKMMKKVAAVASGGLFNIWLKGHGMVAFTCHHDPLTLQVTPEQPVVTDPNATVAWSGTLNPDLKVDMALGAFFGRGSGESIQMHFAGSGFVVVQPYEEVYAQSSGSSS